MKRVIKASYAHMSTPSDRIADKLDELEAIGVSENTILDHLLRWFSADEIVEALDDLYNIMNDEVE